MKCKKTDEAMTAQLEHGKILPLIFRLAVPAIIAQLITFLYNIVDRMYVARIEGAGTEALAALGIVLPITLIIQALSSLIGIGGSPRAGIKLGEGNDGEANIIFNNAFVLLVTVGVITEVLTAVFAKPLVVLFGCPPTAVEYASSYLRIYAYGTVFVMLAQGLNPFILTQGYSFFAMGSVLTGAVINIVLDPIFIFALGMGVRGSALATVISQLVSCIVITLFFFSKKSIFKFKKSDMRLSRAVVLSIVSLGFTPFFMTLTECAVQIVFNICLNRTTGGNKDYTAALTVMLSALQLIMMPLNGLGNGLQPFVSFNYGRGNAERLRKGIKYTTLIAFAFCICAWGVSVTNPVMYAKLFAADESVTEIVKKYGPMFLMGSVMFFVQMTLQNINVALGQAKSALFLATIRKVILLIPLCFVFSHFMGFKGVYLSEGIADLAAGIITAAVIFTTFPKIFAEREAKVKDLNR